MSRKSAGGDNSTERTRSGAPIRLTRLYLHALRAADGPGAYRIAAEALRGGMTTPQLYQQVIAPAMHEVGLLWERGAITVADEHLATALTNRVLEALRPLGEAGSPGPGEDAPNGSQGRALFATIEGEQHALGLRMAADVLEEVGYEAISLGADVPTEALLRAVDTFSPDLVALSATMPTLATQLERVVAEVRRANPEIRLLIGGQAASPHIEGGTLVRDLEQLPERMAGPPQV